MVASGPGLPHGVSESVRLVPGVTAATPVKRTTVVMAVKEMGEKNLRSLNGSGIGADAAATMDPGVSSGRLGDLRGGTVALSRDVAGGLRVGSTAPLWLADGTRIRARVVAVYDRGLGFGDVLLPHDVVAAHSASPLDDRVLVRGRADLSAVTAAYAGAGTVTPDAFQAGLSQEIRLQGFVSLLVVAAITGFILVGLVTTLATATAARRREFALLRLVGATRRQVLRMLRLEAAIVLGTGIAVGGLIAAVTLTAFAARVTGLPLPSVPLWNARRSSSAWPDPAPPRSSSRRAPCCAGAPSLPLLKGASMSTSTRWTLICVLIGVNVLSNVVLGDGWIQIAVSAVTGLAAVAVLIDLLLRGRREP
ncbi:FtsX-like permease family protein [Actinomadura luteofluorescens]